MNTILATITSPQNYYHKKTTIPPQNKHHTNSKTPLFVRTLCVTTLCTPSVTPPTQLHAQLHRTWLHHPNTNVQHTFNFVSASLNYGRGAALSSRNFFASQVLCSRNLACYTPHSSDPAIPSAASFWHLGTGPKAFGLGTRTWLSQRISPVQRLECMQAQQVCQTWTRIEFCQI